MDIEIEADSAHFLVENLTVNVRIVGRQNENKAQNKKGLEKKDLKPNVNRYPNIGHSKILVKEKIHLF